MKRYRNDSVVKPGKGIDTTEGENFTDAYNSYKTYYQPNFPGNIPVPEDRDIKGRKVRNSPGYAAYTSDDDAPLRNERDYQFDSESYDIFDQVNASSDQRGDATNANTGPVREVKK